jgi:hypothetical protein
MTQPIRSISIAAFSLHCVKAVSRKSQVWTAREDVRIMEACHQSAAEERVIHL